MINCANEFEPDVWSIFCNKECMRSLALLLPRNFTVFEANFPSSITLKESRVSPITKFHKLYW